MPSGLVPIERQNSITKLIILISMTLSLAIASPWFNIVGYSSVFESGTEQIFGAVSLPLVFLRASQCIVAVLIMLFFTRVERFSFLQNILFFMPLIPGTLLLGLSAFQTLFSEMMAIGGSVLIGIGYGFCFINFLKILIDFFSPQESVFVFVFGGCLGNIFQGGLLKLEFSGARTEQYLLIAAVLSVALFVLFFLYQFLLKSYSPLSSQQEKREERSINARLFSGKNVTYITQLLFMVIAMLLVRGLSIKDFWNSGSYLSSDYLGIYIVVFADVLFLIVALPSLLFYSKSESIVRSLTPFLVLFTLLFAFFLLYRDESVYTNILNIVIESYNTAFMYLILIISTKKLVVAPYQATSLFLGLTHLLAVVRTWFIGLVDINAEIVLISLTYLIVLVMLFSRTREKTDTTSCIDSNEKMYTQLTDRCRELSESFGLTKREAEILILLVQGRSIPFIQEKLFISNGTARTHSKRIYRKLGVHSKQELINLIDNRHGENA